MRRACLLLCLFVPLAARAADKLAIAAASHLVYALESLNAEFRKAEPTTEVTVVTEASGNLVAQIQNGASFDVFLSADLESTAKLVSLGFADPKTLTKFATGRLVLWTTRPDVDVMSIENAVRDPKVRKLAIANAATAPYGRAAKEALTKLGLWSEAEAKAVIGDSIAQTSALVEMGRADAGFVALSLVLSPSIAKMGRWTEVDPEFYSPLEQAAIVTKRGTSNPASARYLQFLQGAEAKAIFERFGYRPPET